MRFDVYGMCYALFDIQAAVPPSVLEELGLSAGAMYLLDADQHAAVVKHVRRYVVNTAAGGSGANTTIGVACLGGTACFTSRVGSDEFGPAYVRSMEEAGVQPDLPVGEGPTGLCIVLVTPDGQRTMCTHLGEGRNLRPEDLQLDHLRASRHLYVTGYLWDTDTQKEAVRLAIREAHRQGIPVALSLADRFCVQRNREDFLDLLRDSVSLVFGNADEATLLTGAGNAHDAARALSAGGRRAFVTMGAEGALVAENETLQEIPAVLVRALDTTGAGDAFAAGALYGLSRGMSPRDAATLGTRLAAHVVSRMGPRPSPDVAFRP